MSDRNRPYIANIRPITIAQPRGFGAQEIAKSVANDPLEQTRKLIKTIDKTIETFEKEFNSTN